MKGDSKKLLLQAMLTDVRAQLVSAFHRACRAREKKPEQIRHQDLTELRKLIDKLDEAILLEKQSYIERFR
ncbi:MULTISPECIES: hypothetical protein [Sodalis]|uniref:hypothetical protein n=1 Tax=Sodalis TaxID=84565 RepID=UPI00046D216D|nr:MULTISPECIES: hypothetical protein [Sodalis]